MFRFCCSVVMFGLLCSCTISHFLVIFLYSGGMMFCWAILHIFGLHVIFAPPPYPGVLGGLFGYCIPEYGKGSVLSVSLVGCFLLCAHGYMFCEIALVTACPIEIVDVAVPL